MTFPQVLNPPGPYIATNSSTVVGIVTQLNLNPGATGTVTIKVNYWTQYTTLCVESLTCDYCTNAADCTSRNFANSYASSLKSETFFNASESYWNEAVVRYQCAPGMMFAGTAKYQNLSCDWSTSWQPTDVLQPCVCEYHRVK